MRNDSLKQKNKKKRGVIRIMKKIKIQNHQVIRKNKQRRN